MLVCMLDALNNENIGVPLDGRVEVTEHSPCPLSSLRSMAVVFIVCLKIKLGTINIDNAWILFFLIIN